MNRRLLFCFRVLFTCLLLIAGVERVQASHSMGADLTYTCLGGNSYEVTLSFYRDCAGIPVDTAANIVFSSSCFPSDSVDIFQIPGTGQEISPICRNDTTTCNGGTYTGIQEYIFRGIITLPGPCVDWTLGYNLCCRNNAITNIDQPGNTLMYIYATLNNMNGLCDNSPTFSNKPVPFCCLGQQFCYNHGAYDSEGDSLVYSLITPYDSPGLPVTYLAPFTSTQPLSSSPAVSFNTQTGDICMTPTQLEITVMAVLVSEYRNGVLIGSVERDIQITVTTCNNILPTLTGIDGTNVFNMTVCAGAQACFDIFSNDGDVPQNTFVDWDYSIPNAIFTTMPGHHESATFCWTPAQSDVQANPYCFTAIVHDDNCPYTGNQIYAYCITVVGIDVDAGPDQTVLCNASATLTALASGGSGVYSYDWNNGATTASITSGSGTYVVTANDGSCSNSDTVLVNPGPGVPTAAFTMFNTCASLTVPFTNQSTVNGGTIAGYSWLFGDGGTSAALNPTHTYAVAGNYNVMLIVNTVAGCIDTMVQPLHLSLNQPTAAFTPNNVCIGDQVNLTDASVSPGTLSSWQWYWGDGATSPVQNPAHVYATAGNFPVSLVVVNADGCRDSVSHPVTVYALPSPNAGSDQTICNGAYASLSGSGGGTYEWFPSYATTANISVNPGNTQPYFLTVTDVHGCKQTDTVLVTVRRGPGIRVSPDRSICRGDTTTFSVSLTGGGGGGSGPVTYLWTPGGSTLQNLTVFPTVTTAYAVVATDSIGCHSWDTVRVTVNPSPTAMAGADQTFCPGDSVVFSGSGGANYQWSPGGFNTQQITVYPAATTSYTLTVTDTNGCSSTDVVRALLGTVPIASAGPDKELCRGDSVLLSASGGGNYLWSNGSTTQQVTVGPLNNASYVVTVTNATGCHSSDTVNVVVHTPPVVNAGTDLENCWGFIDTLTASGGVLQYAWSPGGFNTQQIFVNPDTTTTYTVIVTDTNGCHDTDMVKVTINALPIPDAGPNQILCFGDTTTLVAGGGSSYLWMPGGSSLQQLVIIPDTSITYTLLVTDTNGCQAMDTISILVDPLLNSLASATDALCHDSLDGTATVLPTGGTPPYQYSWSPSGGTLETASGLPADTFTVTVTDSLGCTSRSATIVNEPLPLVLQVSVPETICIGQEATLTVSASGGHRPYQFLWSTGETDTSVIVAPVVSTSYNVSVVDSNHCSLAPDTVLVPVFPPVVVNASAPVAICFGDAAAISSVAAGGNGGPYTYSWNDSAITTPGSPVVLAGDSTFIVTASDGCSPFAFDTVAVIVNPLPLVDFLPHQVQGCMPVSVDFKNFYPQPAGTTYSWDLDDHTTSTEENPSHVYESPGHYGISLLLVSPQGCRDSVSLDNTVIVYGFPNAAFYQSSDVLSSFYPSVSFSDNSMDAQTWQWDFGDGSALSAEQNPVHEYPDTGTYTVRLVVTNNGGCPDTIYGTVRVEQEFTLYIPNAFTPNNNGVNDGFIALGVGFIDYDMWILDRWGKKIFHSTSIEQPWDGSFYGNGTFCQADVYEYVISVHDYKGKLHRYIGHVALVR